jgi:hypothetical protein
MGMIDAMRLADLAAQERERRQQARQAVQDGHLATFAAVQVLGATLLAQAAQERATACRRLLGSDLVAESVVRLLAVSGGHWRGTMASLMADASITGMHVIHLGRKLRKITRHLRRVGIRVRAFPTYKRRLVVIDIHNPALFNDAVLALSGQLH